MDDRTFDRAARVIGVQAGATRRQAVGLLVGSVGVLLSGVVEDAEAKKRKKKRKKGFRCTPDGFVCPATTQRDCCGLQCCLVGGEPEGGVRFCTDWRNTCCIAELGGGACPYDYPFCCGDGLCGETLQACFPESELTGAVRVPRIARTERE